MRYLRGTQYRRLEAQRQEEEARLLVSQGTKMCWKSEYPFIEGSISSFRGNITNLKARSAMSKAIDKFVVGSEISATITMDRVAVLAGHLQPDLEGTAHSRAMPTPPLLVFHQLPQASPQPLSQRLCNN